MDRFWQKEYAPGVPAEIDNGGYRSLRDLIETSFKEYAARPAYTCMDVTLTYADLDRLSRHMAAYLQERAHLQKGDRLAIMLPNILQYPVVLCAALRAGLVVVNVNPLYTRRELEHQLRDSGAKAIVILENFANTLEKVVAETPVDNIITTSVGDLFPTPKRQIVNFMLKYVKKAIPSYNLPGAVSFRDALYDGGQLVFQPPDIDLGDLAFLQYTGGTTGVAKGAMLSHRNLVYNIEQSTAWLGTMLDDDEPDIAITALPLYHIFSLEGNCLSMMKRGGHNILIPNPRDAEGFVKELGKYRFSYFTGVNTLFSSLLNTPGFDKLDFSSLKITVGGGMAVQEPVARRWKEVTGNTLTQAYGLTETSPAAVMNPFTEDAAFNGSIGLPISSTEVTIRDDDGREVPIGQSGEICIRGPQVMEGYWNRPEETEKVMLEDGWFKTGDMGRMDERGYVYIEDRKKDMILVSGFNVYPNEIEEVIASLDEVLEVAAVGQPDERSGEVVKVFVVRKDPSLTKEKIIAHCRENLTGYKMPKAVEFRDELPKTNVGKILRRALRDED